ncbi:release factor H-coupled RctB family protein [Capsaspora owczarzaki ATCC 30864]|uniref:release factor H-coupled RctB family protein n=1 Tax=Capsaspora owczarzaki (strain ATCC 30864) TaxID=595528 RepID=UPI0003521C70|nr:release factor H-coupled RctB family protein [Capsaspora owczarzaki ATCC 30864]|eukprot:XP_004345156.2 release factor H-coupled RctB family protein [Capsaspora owczarzaki ATCC 30864]
MVEQDTTYTALVSSFKQKLRIKAKALYRIMPDGSEMLLQTDGDVTGLPSGCIVVGSTTAAAATSTTATASAAASTPAGASSSSTPQISAGNGDSASASSSAAQLAAPSIRVLADKSWTDDDAVKQLHQVAASLEDVVFAVGLPDLHVSKGFPVGTAFATRSIVYPALIGDDIGCGMALFKTEMQSKHAHKADKWLNKLHDLDRAYQGEDVPRWLREFDVEPTEHDAACLGTIGGGNHFAELQQVERVENRELFAQLGMTEESLYLLVHSGSRGFGRAVLSRHLDTLGAVGVAQGSPACETYLKSHDHACRWARCNRAIIANRFLDALNTSGTQILDIWHNSVARTPLVDGSSCWLHRKGAAPADKGPVVIPGSRGAFSYLVMPTSNADAQEFGGYSLAHGAGRKWARSKALAVGKSRFPQPSALTTTPLGSHVVCEDKQLLYEEAPDAYKEISDVVDDLQSKNLIQVVAVMRPVISYKTRANEHPHK